MSQWQFGQRFIDAPEGVDRPKWRTTLSYRFAPTLQAGLELNAEVGELGLIANWFAMRETLRNPALIFGTSSDRIGTPEGNQAYYLTVSKSVSRFSPYVSVNYSEFDRGFNFPFGGTVFLNDHWSVLPMYDGQAAHTILTWSGARGASIQLIAAWNRRCGIAFGYRF